MCYTVQQPGYFNLLPTPGRQSRRNKYFKGKKCFSAQNIFSLIGPNKIQFNKQM
jgi:hypothetical protein